MFDRRNKVQFHISRLAVLGIVVFLMFSYLCFHLFQLQIVNGQSYADNFMMQIEKNRTLKSVRGKIYDRNGVILADNRLAYFVTLEDRVEYSSTKERQLSLNSIAYRIINIVGDYNKMSQSVPILLDDNEKYVFNIEGVNLSRWKADMYGRSKISDLTEPESLATADEIMEYLCRDKKFAIQSDNTQIYSSEELEMSGLPDQYTKQEILGIANIRYALSLNSYRRYLPVTVAMDVSEETVASIKEHKPVLPGVEIEASSVRVYEGGESFSHILGYTGKISSEELDKLNLEEEIYTNQSMLGKSGIEQYMESFLKGTDGSETIFVNNVGNELVEPETTIEPLSGQDVYLSIDKELQMAAYQILEQRIAGILAANIVNIKEADLPPAREASQIVIAIDQVYTALLNNKIIDIDALSLPGATALEQDIYSRFRQKKTGVLADISLELEGNKTAYDNLSKELQDYQDYIVKEILVKQEILSPDKEDWKRGDTSLEDYLSLAIKNGWVDFTKIPANDTYVELDEAKHLMKEEILGQLETDDAFDTKIYGYMIRNGELADKDVCLLLYEQGILQTDDEDYLPLTQDQITPHQFMLSKIQKLQITPAQLALNPCSGSVVVTDPNTGEILACVSYPGYDNNRLANQMDADYYRKLSTDLSLPLYNRATQQLTAPGSTFKPITIIAGLNEGVIQTDTQIKCTGVFDKVETPLRCWNRYGHGNINSSMDGIKNSCNVYMCEVTYRMGTGADEIFSEQQGLKTLQDYALLFDLDKKTGIELAESQPHVTDQFAIPSSIGQGTHNYTTAQLARYVGTLANQGTSYHLSVLKKVVNSEGQTTKEFLPQPQSQIDLPQEIWNDVKAGMNQVVVNNATLKTLSISAAGKTGTAEEVSYRPNHGLFVGYAPLDNPQIAVAVRIANGYTSGNAVGVARDIFSYRFDLEPKEKILTGTAAKASTNAHTD